MDVFDMIKMVKHVNESNKTDEEVFYVLDGFIHRLQKAHDRIGNTDCSNHTERVMVLLEAKAVAEDIVKWIDE